MGPRGRMFQLAKKALPAHVKRRAKPAVFKAAALRSVVDRALPPEGGIRLAVLIAYPQMWNTVKPLYDEARARDIECSVLAVSRFRNGEFDDASGMSAFLEEAGVEHVVVNCAAEEPQAVLYALLPSHVVYVRPYVSEYPEGLRPLSVRRAFRTCLLPYTDIATLPNPHYQIDLNEEFLCGIDVVFPSPTLAYEAVCSDFSWYVRHCGMRIVDTPDPRLDVAARYFEGAVPNLDYFTIVYTPRWAVEGNPHLSSFFAYLPSLIDYVMANDGVRLILRPHPLAFDHYVQAGRMTSSDIDVLADLFDASPQLELNVGGDYLPAFAAADVMLSDVSSLVRSFFVSGKPIIYTDDPLEFRGTYQSAYRSMYKVSDWAEVESTLDSLRRGDDPKAIDRLSALREVQRGWSRGRSGAVVLDALTAHECEEA